MPCSPHLQGLTDLLEILRVIAEHPILLWSEPPQTFYPLQEKGWAFYQNGAWQFTEEGHKLLSEVLDPSRPQTLEEFFEL